MRKYDWMGCEIKHRRRPDPIPPFDERPNLPGFIYVAAKTDKELQPTELAREVHQAGVRERVARIRTKADARDYFEEVRRKLLTVEPEV
jgi:hypothetical protein